MARAHLLTAALMPAEPHIRSPFPERLAPQSLILEVIGLGRAGPALGSVMGDVDLPEFAAHCIGSVWGFRSQGFFLACAFCWGWLRPGGAVADRTGSRLPIGRPGQGRSRVRRGGAERRPVCRACSMTRGCKSPDNH